MKSIKLFLLALAGLITAESASAGYFFEATGTRRTDGGYQYITPSAGSVTGLHRRQFVKDDGNPCWGYFMDFEFKFKNNSNKKGRISYPIQPGWQACSVHRNTNNLGQFFADDIDFNAQSVTTDTGNPYTVPTGDRYKWYIFPDEFNNCLNNQGNSIEELVSEHYSTVTSDLSPLNPVNLITVHTWSGSVTAVVKKNTWTDSNKDTPLTVRGRASGIDSKWGIDKDLNTGSDYTWDWEDDVMDNAAGFDLDDFGGYNSYVVPGGFKLWTKD